MKIGDKIVIKKSIALHNAKGEIISSIEGADPRNYNIKIDQDIPIVITLTERAFSVINDKNVSLKDYFFIEEGCDGIILKELRHSFYLCKFEDPHCTIELSEDEIISWSPKDKVFRLLDHVRLTEDVSEENLKKGMEGYIVLVFFRPSLAYEVEFFLEGVEFPCYTLLPHQLEFIDSLK